MATITSTQVSAVKTTPKGDGLALGFILKFNDGEYLPQEKHAGTSPPLLSIEKSKRREVGGVPAGKTNKNYFSSRVLYSH